MADDRHLEPPEWVSTRPVATEERAPPTGPTRIERRRQQARATRRRRGKGAATLVVLACLLLPFGLVAGWFWYQLDPPGSPGREVAVTVEQGWSTERIADALEERGVIGSALVFRVYGQVTSAGPFRAGTYTLREDMGVRAAIDALEGGGTPLAAAVIEVDVGKPGLTLAQIADRVGKLPDRSRDRFLEAAASGRIRSRYQPPEVTSLEGLTYPAVYELSAEATEEEILQAMVTKFDEVAAAAGIDAAPALGVTPYQAAIVASMIQREAGVPEDRSNIAAVVYNRLRRGVPLQIDATVNYARGSFDGPPGAADLALDSPYNTYAHAGLPPTPIGTFTADDLTAALNPTPGVAYEFYVLIDESGAHAFANTYEEHLANIEIARQKGLL